MRWLVWLLVAVSAVAGVAAACGGGAPEREVGSQRPVEQEAGSRPGASGDDAADGLADALEADDDRGGAQDSNVDVQTRVIATPLTREAAEAAEEARSSNGTTASGLPEEVGGVEVPDDAIRVTVFPMTSSLTVEGPGALRSSPFPLPLQLAVGPWSCAVGVDQPASDEAEGRFVVTFGDFDESGSEAVVEAAEPEWSGEARLDVVESEDEDKMATTRAIPGIVGSMEGRVLTATIESELSDGRWTISCQRVEE